MSDNETGCFQRAIADRSESNASLSKQRSSLGTSAFVALLCLLVAVALSFVSVQFAQADEYNSTPDGTGLWLSDGNYVKDGMTIYYQINEDDSGNAVSTNIVQMLGTPTKSPFVIPNEIQGLPVVSFLSLANNDRAEMAVEFSGNSALTDISFNFCSFDSVTIKNCENLLTVDGDRVWCSSFTVTGCPKLEKLLLPLNEDLASLDVSSCVGLKELDVYMCHLSSLDVTKNTKLEKLQCSENNLTTLDISKNTALTKLYCYNNLLTDVSALEAWAQQKGLTIGTEISEADVVLMPQRENPNVSNPDTSAPSASDGAWVKSGSRWWYKYADGSYPTGFKAIGDATYYFDANGWMKTGWQKIEGDWYYFKSSGAMTTGWQKVSGKWYFMDGDGVMLTGKIVDNGRTYFLNASGAMQTGWVKDEGKWYYCGPSGDAIKGWKKVNGTWYFLGNDCVMKTGWMQDDGKMYYLQSSGAMTKGWSKIGDAWYHFATSGAMNTGWLKSGGKWYYLDPSNGIMQTGKQIVDEKPYFFKDSGALRTGWVQDGADWYYYTNGGVLKTNAWISGKYWVGADGVMATNAWVDGDEYYVGEDGAWVKDQPAPAAA